MVYRFSAVVAMIVAICFSAMAGWTPPNSTDNVGVDTKGVIFIKASKIIELSPQVNPPGVMSQLMTKNHKWISGLRMKREGDYFIYETGYSVPLGQDVLFCFYLGVDFWVPDCYYEGMYGSFAVDYNITDWQKNAPFNGALGAGHNFCFPSVLAR